MLNDATARQVTASDPNSSTWLSANAGSGKTRVLTDRVARLLLQDVEPQRILCLTYTKAAASEMQNRLFKTLGQWAMKPDAALRVALSDLGEGLVDDAHLARARRLFARAIETPGGLRIQTIHSFCAALLRRFPLEAGVSPQFGELDDRSGRLLRQDILEEMAESLAPQVVSAVARQFSGDFMGLVEQIVAKREGFDATRAPPEPTETVSDIIADVFLGSEADWMQTVLDVLRNGSSNDVKAHDQLVGIDYDQPDFAALAVLEGALLYGEGATKNGPYKAKLGAFPTKNSRAALGQLQSRLEDFMGRVELARPRRIAVQASLKTAVLHDFANTFLPLYAARKAQHGWLDFDDLITRATHLVTDPSVAAWVLYRLDGGIDHVLVDEAQDTGPGQWRVIELLTAEFTAGDGAHQGGRTVFVVGDQKQSIYSFQGADVAAFDDKHRAFEQRFSAVGQRFQSLKLEHSFRSSPAVLGFVDAALQGLDARALGAEIAHIAFKDALPGRVDLWPLIEGEKDPVDKNFEDPVDLIAETHHSAKLADKIALAIRGMLEQRVQIVTQQGKRPVHAGDFLILVQSRSTIFTEIIRACKQQGLPIAGADRLKLGAELAVKDLLALLAFLDMPEDNLSLAAVLRSPLCGLTESELYDLAHGRSGTLWDAMQGQAGRFGVEVAMLDDLRGRVDYLRPYDLLERVLIEHGGRSRMIARLGDEAEDGIDELLNQCLAYERAEVPSLTGFLIWLDADEIDVKRQAEGAGHRIRVMTVHGAKGLESEIVILPDTADHRPQDRDEIYLGADKRAIWKTPSAESPPEVSALREAKAARDAEENLRLFYVAMTRARTWLMMAGAGAVTKPASWYAIAQTGMARLGAVQVGDVLRHETDDWPVPVPAAPLVQESYAAPPDWALTKPAEPDEGLGLLRPSDLGGAKALPGEPMDEEEASGRERGTAIHLLLQHLPDHSPAVWPDVARHLVPQEGLCADAMAEVVAVLTAPYLHHLFAPGSLAEVGVTGEFGGQRIYGVIDRLIVTETSVLAIDYKSNSLVPVGPEHVPEGLLRQMGAYDHVLRALYPNRQIETLILWTRTRDLMPLGSDIVKAALLRALG